MAQMSSKIPHMTSVSGSVTVDEENPNPTKVQRKNPRPVIKSEIVDPTFELAEVEKNRNLLLAKLRAGTDYLSSRRNVSIKNQKDFDEESKNVTLSLIERMHRACIQDYDCIKKGTAAMHRFKMINEVQELLKKKHIQDIFLEMQGCRFLEMWIIQNPDNSFPPIQIVECVIGVLDLLPISQEQLESCQVARAVTYFAASGDDKQFPASLVSSSTKLLQKW
jgi:hypothetical protein